MAKKVVTLIINTPEKDSNLLYLSNFFCIDPFALLVEEGKTIAWIPSTEFEKAKAQSSINTVYNLSEYLDKIGREKKLIQLKSSVVIDYLKRNSKDYLIKVPESFPVIEADNFRNCGFELSVVQEPFLPQRAVKSQTEIDMIRENSLKNSQVMNEVKNIIQNSTVDSKNILVYEGRRLTSEYIQSFILKQFLDRRLFSQSAIVALGDQGCSPHEYGSGFVYANQSIIVDIYPRSVDNLYFSDMTRTFCKGKAPDELKKIYNAVLEIQTRLLEKLHAREDGKKLHNFVIEFFENKGHKTGVKDGFLQGFFHGTGHGLGLDCHEAPYISKNGSEFEENNLVTVEPGLYYLGVGGVRIEDLVVIKQNGIENLTNFEKILEIE
ncbi:MAG TPA: Xaa-Pro peptidase family protein [Spirochaetota bacterium]|jgi:Xaa-Pro aminopeptidase|nr:MAG: Aminopeptidase [Spirochaetes bacterium ADurb.Bin133]HNZ25864.1 Xaa-Pro peptidase family protein [Spirochaetota bacterium]HPY88663.1 Xaa-Pro peptidase family protein [Spirochaetota bacterium]